MFLFFNIFSWFIHRSGRSGRCGREGKSLLFLTPNQDGYITFLQKYEKISLNELKIPNLTAVKAEQLRQKIIKMASKDRFDFEDFINIIHTFFSFLYVNHMLISLQYFFLKFLFRYNSYLVIHCRLILERGTSAFVSFIESYLRHDCSVVCPFKGIFFDSI